jgi:hypothetical protein
MDETMEDILMRFRRPGAPPGLRGRVLGPGLMESHARRRLLRWRHRALAAAAVLLLSIAMGLGLEAHHEARLSALVGARRIPELAAARELAREVLTPAATDNEIAEFERYLVLRFAGSRSRNQRNRSRYFKELRRYANE